MKYFLILAAIGAVILVGTSTPEPPRDTGLMPEVVAVGDAPDHLDGLMPEVVIRAKSVTAAPHRFDGADSN